MSKRFVDSVIWDNDEFLSASPNQKVLFFFAVQKCDNIGIYKISHKLASFLCGFDVTESLLLSIPCDIEKIADSTYWMPKFVYHQYGDLSEACKPHKRYIEDLKKHGLFERASKGYAKGKLTLEEKEEEKEQEEDKEKDSYTCIPFKENKEEESTVLCPAEIVNIEQNAQPSLLPSQVAIERPIISTLPNVLPTRKRGLKPLTEPNDAAFAEWWSAYPRKTGKLDAFTSWEKSWKIRPPVAEMIATLEWQKQSAAWTKDNGQFIPMPSTYLNQGRWTDEAPPAPKTYEQRMADELEEINKRHRARGHEC